MTKEQVQIMLAVIAVAIMNQLEALMGSAAAELVLDGTTSVGADSIVGKYIVAKTAFAADPDLFITTQASIDNLDDVADAISALENPVFSEIASDAIDALQTASPEA